MQFHISQINKFVKKPNSMAVPRDRYTKPNLPAHPTQETMQTTTAMGGGIPFMDYKHTD